MMDSNTSGAPYPFAGADDGNGGQSSIQNMFDPGYDSGNWWQKAWGLLDPAGSSLFEQYQNGKNGHASTNPADAAMAYYNKIRGDAAGIYQPYMDRGNAAVTPFLNGQGANGITNPYLQNGAWAGQNLQQQTSDLVNNPTGKMNQIGSTFKQSPGYAWQTQQATQAVNNAAAAGGMAGSPLQQQNSANVVNQLANQDYYNYLNHGIGMYNQGYQGLQSMYGTGAQTANNMYDIAGNIANSMYGAGANAANQYGDKLTSGDIAQGNLAYLGQQNTNQQRGANQAQWAQMLGGIGNMFSSSGSGGGGGMGGGFGSMFGGGQEGGQDDGSGGQSGNMMSTIMKLAPLVEMMFV